MIDAGRLGELLGRVTMRVLLSSPFAALLAWLFSRWFQHPFAAFFWPLVLCYALPSTLSFSRS